MTSGNWSEEIIEREKTWIEEWGKAKVTATPIRECHGATPNVSTCCAFGCCSCKVTSWVYSWTCWCFDGYNECSWELAVDQLEKHMIGGYHK